MTDTRRRVIELPSGLGELTAGRGRARRVRYSLKVEHEYLLCDYGSRVEVLPVRGLVSGRLTMIEGTLEHRSDLTQSLQLADGRTLDFIPSEVDVSARLLRIDRAIVDRAFLRLEASP